MMVSHNLQAQSDYVILKDKDTPWKIYKGVFTFQDIHAESTFGWLKHGYESYKPDTNDIMYLKKNLGNYTIVAFIGTWCDDTHKLLPRFEKVLNLSSFPMKQYTMLGVDLNKKSKNEESRLYKIENVPTFIIYKGHREIGRIVETVKKSIEEDLVDIVSSDAGPSH